MRRGTMARPMSPRPTKPTLMKYLFQSRESSGAGEIVTDLPCKCPTFRLRSPAETRRDACGLQFISYYDIVSVSPRLGPAGNGPDQFDREPEGPETSIGARRTERSLQKPFAPGSPEVSRTKKPTSKGPYRVGGEVQAPKLIYQVQPVYPPLAKQAR